MFRMPPATSPLYLAIDADFVASMMDPATRAKLPNRLQARTSAQAFLAAEPIATSINYLVDHEGNLLLLEFSREWPGLVQWNFGTGRDGA